MPSRRDFLAGLLAGSAALAFPGRGFASPLAQSGLQEQAARTATGKYRPPFRFGLGGAPIGGSVGVAVSDADAAQILEDAWRAGVRLYDTSPWYGLGLSERRFGRLLHDKPRDQYVLSTKIGRILTAAPKAPKTAWANPDSFNYTYDYSASATRRSIEDSLQRLGVSSIDIALIHDLSRDQADIKDRYEELFKQATEGAMKELTRMREEGIIKAWGLGVNTLEPILSTLKVAEPDLFLAACQYSLIEHQESVDRLFPACRERGVSLIIGSPLNAGFLAGSQRYNYGPTIPPQHLQKRERLRALCAQHNVDLRTAALQFASAPEVVSAIIPGARQPQQVGENVESMGVKIPAAFWQELRSQGLIVEGAPIPA